MSTAAINNAIALRFPTLSHALMWEVAPGDAGKYRYADAVAIGLWASHGHMIQGIEVKASRSDFQKEMEHPEKSEPIMRYCHRWWLACPKGLVKPDEIPANWGMLELVGDALRVKVKAPLLKPAQPSLAFFASLCRRRVGGDDEMYSRRVATEVQSQVLSERTRLEGRLNNERSSRARSAEDGLVKLERIKAETGIDLTSYHGCEDIIAAIRAYRAVNGNWQMSLKRLREAHAAALTAIDGIEFFEQDPAA